VNTRLHAAAAANYSEGLLVHTFQLRTRIVLALRFRSWIFQTMEQLEYLRRQFAYDEWANREVLAGLKASTHPAVRPLQLLAHILAAERLWLERIRTQSQTLPVWPDFTFDQCEAQIAELAQLWRDFLGQLSPAGLSEKITYKNSNGEA